MANSRLSPRLTVEEFVAAITDQPDPAATAAVAAAILGDDRREREPRFAAAILRARARRVPACELLDAIQFGIQRTGEIDTLREAGFNPDEPRDEKRRWTAGGAGTPGTKDNGYNGLGAWEFKTEEEAIAFFNSLLDPKGNKFPDDWVTVAKDGCVGVNLLRVGWNGLSQPKNAFFLPGAVYFTKRTTAEARLDELAKANPDKKYLLIAAQLPTTGNGQKIADALGDNAITVKSSGLHLDLNRITDFNFSTWFPAGYWEYMNHHWKRFDDPNDRPALKHKKNLPDLGKEFLTLYGVVEHRPWKK